MDVLITGAGGFLGRLLAQRIVALGEPGETGQQVRDIVLLCHSQPTDLPVAVSERCAIKVGDVADAKLLADLVHPGMSIFHLAAVVSGAAERDFDLAVRTNLTGTQRLLECARAAGNCKLVFASSTAVFGGQMPAAIGDSSRQNPQTTYGMTKAAGELLVNDYARKNYVDGRSARLPAVIIRPGKPNQAASSFVSGMFREPLAGTDYTIPVAETTPMLVAGYAAAVEGIIAIHNLAPEQFGFDRAVGIPALMVTVSDMIDCMEKLRTTRSNVGAVTVKRDAFIEKICAGWPCGIDNTRALQLGLPLEESLDAIVARYIADYVDK